MKTVQILSFLVIIISTISFGQLPVPYNGVKKSEASAYVLYNAKIIVGPDNIIKKGSLVIQNGKIKSVGKQVRHPKGAVLIDMEGKTIVPSFIESYSSIGLPKATGQNWAPRPQIESSKSGAYYWNEAIHPEVEAAQHFKVDKKGSENLQKMGFSVAVTHIDDRIARGNGAIVALGDLEHKDAVIKSNGGAYFSFHKGVSKQSRSEERRVGKECRSRLSAE